MSSPQKQQQYRGYDSAGVCVDAPTGAAGKGPLVIKHQGKISDLRARAAEVFSANGYCDAQTYDNHIGVGHTRWATHGPPSAANSHPHVSGADGAFVVVHNGIITNYAVLKPFLEKNGAVFVSETDTEVVPHLLEYLWQRRGGKATLPQLVMEACSKLEGAYALLIKSARYPNELVAAKQGSPLVYGTRKGGVPVQLPGGAAAPASSSANGANSAANGAAADGGVARDQGGRLSAGNSLVGGAGVEVWLASDSAALLTHTRDVVVRCARPPLHLAFPSLRRL